MTGCRSAPLGLQDLVIQVAPAGVFFFDQSDLPRPVPLFHGLFFADGAFHRVVDFVPDEVVHLVAFGEALDEVVFVLPNSLGEVGGDAYV